MAENQITIDVLLGVEQANKRLASLEGQFSKFGTSTERGLGKARLAFTSFVGNLGAIGVTKALSLAADGAKKFFDVFIVGGVQAAQETEESLNALNVSLAMTGDFSNQASLDLTNFAASVQATTSYSDDLVVSNLAVLHSLTRLTGDGLKRAQKAAIDLAATFNMDLGTATEMVGKAATGNITSFQKMGIEIVKGKNDAETFANALQALAKFTGAAEGKTNTYAGAIARAKNAFNDLQEKTGDFIVRNPVVIKLIGMATDAFQKLEGFVKDNQMAILEFVNGGIASFVKGIGFALVGLDYWIRAMQAAQAPMFALIKSSQMFYHILNFDFKNATAKGKEALDELVNGFGKLTNEGVIGLAGDALVDYGKDLAEFSRKHKTFTTQAPKNTADMVQKEKDLIGQLTDFYSDANTTRIEDLKSTFGTIASLMGTSTGLLFDIGKAAAISSATIDGIMAVQKALASAPPPFNFALAALVGVATAANVAKIASQQPPKFAEGGFIPGNHTQGDNVTVRANSRELMLNMEQQATLFNRIQGGDLGGGGDTFHIHVGSIDSESRLQRLTKEIGKLTRTRNLNPRLAF